ncbi:cation:proton antiporter [Candidatus Micrarchaeota archaeon]|nr:cation:proton antiporter [Candidatus Micrarchaeota archaeon]
MKKIATLLVLGVFLVLMFTIIRASLFEQVEQDKHVYFEIVFLLLLAMIGELAVIYFRQPSVMILMLLGILMSPSFTEFGWQLLKTLPIDIPEHPPDIFRMEDILHVFAQLGAVILLFKVGLHNKIDNIFSKENIIIAFVGVLVPFAAGAGFALFYGGSFAYSMFLGAALTATSVGVTVAVLKEYKLLQERYARIIIGAAVIDDILSLLVLSFVINIGSGGSFLDIGLTLLSVMVFLAGGVMAGKTFIEYIDRKEMSNRRFLAAMAFMLFYAYVAEYIKLSAIVGAFLAGIVLNQSKHSRDLEEKTYGLEQLFLPIFFISLGIFFDINSLWMSFGAIVAISIIAVASKFVAPFIAIPFCSITKKEAGIIGMGIVPRGEVALIVASIGLTTGILNSIEYSVISAVALITTLIVPPILGKMISGLQK